MFIVVAVMPRVSLCCRANPEVAELQPHARRPLPAIADEQVHRRQVAVQRLAAMQPPQDVEDAGNLAAHGRLGPAFLRAAEERGEIAVPRIFERKVVQHLPVGAHERKHVVHADRARVPAEQLAEIRLADPAVHARAHLEAHDLRDVGGAADALRQERLAESPFSDQPFDAVAQPRLRALDDLPWHEQRSATHRGHVDRPRRPRRRAGDCVRHRGFRELYGGGKWYAAPMRPDPIVVFYSGGGDAAGRTLRQILAWNDQTLEEVHDYIQWVFPTEQRSAVNPSAPLVTGETIRAFGADPHLRGAMRDAFTRMLAFYGLRAAADDTGAVRVSIDESRFPRRAATWLTPNNHNHLRLTRIMQSLAALGLRNEAAALQRCLVHDVAGGHGADSITPATLRFWRDAVHQGVHGAR